MLDDRAKLLLKTLVERYIAEGSPVGSRTLAKASGVDLSAATIRNVMSDLEELGLVASPHTSAGRVPTSRGYRLFVDTMLTTEDSEAASPIDAPALSPDQPQRVIASAAQLLSSLSSYVGVVQAPRRASVFRHIEFLRLGERRVLLIIVSPEGDVQNRMLITTHDFSQSELVEATNYLNHHFAGLDIESVRERLRAEIVQLQGTVAQLMQAAVSASSEVLHQNAQDEIIVSGEHNLLAYSEFSEVGNLRKAFDLFEQKAQLLRLLEASQQADGVRIYIGGESGVVPVDELSVVSAPYTVNGRVVGQLAVVGPTRMPYERMIRVVSITSRMVSNALTYQP